MHQVHSGVMKSQAMWRVAIYESISNFLFCCVTPRGDDVRDKCTTFALPFSRQQHIHL